MPREKCWSHQPHTPGCVGWMEGGSPALPTRSGQMAASQGGLALPSAEAPSNLKHREEEMNTSRDLQTPHAPCLNWHCHPRRDLEKAHQREP